MAPLARPRAWRGRLLPLAFDVGTGRQNAERGAVAQRIVLESAKDSGPPTHGAVLELQDGAAGVVAATDRFPDGTGVGTGKSSAMATTLRKTGGAPAAPPRSSSLIVRLPAADMFRGTSTPTAFTFIRNASTLSTTTKNSIVARPSSMDRWPEKTHIRT